MSEAQRSDMRDGCFPDIARVSRAHPGYILSVLRNAP
jgi:hypothetical protein